MTLALSLVCPNCVQESFHNTAGNLVTIARDGGILGDLRISNKEFVAHFAERVL